MAWAKRSLNRVRRNLWRVAGVAMPMSSKYFVRRYRDKLRPSDVFVASFPRSGNTWMRLLLADVILQQAGFVTGSPLPIDPRKVVPEFDTGTDPNPDPSTGLAFRVLKTHSLCHPLITKAIMIFRLPSSSLCSYFHFYRQFHGTSHATDDGIDAFCRRTVYDWQEHVESYLDAKCRGQLDMFSTCYEQMHTEPVRVVQGVCGFLGIEADEATCRRAVEHQQFSRLRPLQKDFFRRGEVYSGAQELSPKTLALIEKVAMPTYQRAAECLTLQPVRQVA